MSGPIYLHPNGGPSQLGEDTFWVWAYREFPGATFEKPERYPDGSVVLVYSACGKVEIPGGTKVCCCWELYPELVKAGFQVYQANVDLSLECLSSCDAYTTHSRFQAEFYDKYGKPRGARLMPLAVDTDRFKPLPDRASLRQKHGIPIEAKVGFWSGTNHPMKGFDRAVQYAQSNPGIFWIVAWKRPEDAGRSPLPGKQYRGVDQVTLNELMNCADFALFTSRLRPYYMVEWEAMACNLPVVDVSGIERDFVPTDCNFDLPACGTRGQVMSRRWDRESAKVDWLEFIEEVRTK